MPGVEEVNVSMTSEQAKLIRDAVQSGAYASGSDVVREALADWSAKWESRRDDIAKLREMWAEGKASGTPTEVDFDALLAEARAELNSARKHAG
jgi:antitoxin ParD1/3/4